MIVLKFGGTSVGTPDALKKVVSILKEYSEKKIVVLSAISGVTNKLESINTLLKNNKKSDAVQQIEDLRAIHIEFCFDLFQVKNTRVIQLINSHFESLLSITNDGYLPQHELIILAQGELLSSHILNEYLISLNIDNSLISALDFMRTDKDFEPDSYYIKDNLFKIINQCQTNTYVTQGFICRNVFGEIDNLKRGGSDYSATLISEAIEASQVQIWTDIDGMHNNDPRYVSDTMSINSLHYDEASELAYFGAKILHPSCVFPAKRSNIPLYLKNTMNPSAQGTLISSETSSNPIKAIAAKDNITAIKIKSARMLNAYGFLRSVFEVFERYKTPIDMITTSEVAVSLSIDSQVYLKEISKELEYFGEVEIDQNQSIICVVGDFSPEKCSQANKVFSALKEIPIRMISYGGSYRNVSILVNSNQKISALKALHINCYKA